MLGSGTNQERPMAYTISYTTPAGAFSFTKETAREALDMAMDYIHEGYRHVKIEDTDKGITYSTHNIRRAWRSGKGLEEDAAGSTPQT
jgi:hypothetical protein